MALVVPRNAGVAIAVVLPDARRRYKLFVSASDVSERRIPLSGPVS
jgi:hypothetical protein